MEPLVEFCEQNLVQGSYLVAEDPYVLTNSDVMTYSCLNECTLCAQKFFAFFEGERLEGDTPQELLGEVKKVLLEWHEEYD